MRPLLTDIFYQSFWCNINFHIRTRSSSRILCLVLFWDWRPYAHLCLSSHRASLVSGRIFFLLGWPFVVSVLSLWRLFGYALWTAHQTLASVLWEGTQRRSVWCVGGDFTVVKYRHLWCITNPGDYVFIQNHNMSSFQPTFVCKIESLTKFQLKLKEISSNFFSYSFSQFFEIQKRN